MHVIMQMHKHSNIIVERADFSFIMLRFLNTDTMFFYFIFYFINIVIYLFLEYLSYSIVHLTLLFIILDLY